MPASEFRPGFRLSITDLFGLLLGATAAGYLWSRAWWLAMIIALVISHFFLFCNIVRMSRPLELIWAATFLLLAWLTVGIGYLTWPAFIALTLCVTAALVFVQMRKPSYHGLGWHRLNPNLRTWWETHGQK